MSKHAILTCKHHPHLRWSCKDIAISNGGYNGTRSIFFCGEPTGKGMYHDGSGLDCATYINVDGHPRIVYECDCPSSDLVLAPENDLVTR